MVFSCDRLASGVEDVAVFQVPFTGVLLFLICGLFRGLAEEVVIEREWSFESLASEEEVSLGRYEFSRLQAGVGNPTLEVGYRSLAGERVKNPASVDFDFQYSLDSEVILIGRFRGEEVFQITSGRYEVVDHFFGVPAGEEVLREFADERIFQGPIEETGMFAGEEIELFFKVRQTKGEGNLELSTLEGYRSVEVSVAFTFASELNPFPSPEIDVKSRLVGPGEGVVNFMTRQGFDYHLIWAESFATPEVLRVVRGTSTDRTFTFAELEIVSPRGFFWVEEYKVDEGS